MSAAPWQIQVQEQVDLVKLRQNIDTYFNDSELRTLCFDMSIDYDDLPGTSKGDKARELVAHCIRHGLMNELVQSCYTRRPHVTWWAPKKLPVGQVLLIVGVLLLVVLGFHLVRYAPTFLSPSIESLSSHVWTWGGDFDTDPSTGGRSDISDISFREQGVGYEVSYFLPEADSLWAGISFELSPQNKNLTSYRAIKLTLDLGAGTGCKVSIIDDKGARDELSLGITTPPSSDSTVTTDKQSQIITIPLATNFRSVNFESVKEIAFTVGSGFPRGAQQRFVIRNIRLLKW
jgi:hypothetical protein